MHMRITKYIEKGLGTRLVVLVTYHVYVMSKKRGKKKFEGPWVLHSGIIQPNTFRSIVQSMVQSRVHGPGFEVSPIIMLTSPRNHIILVTKKAYA